MTARPVLAEAWEFFEGVVPAAVVSVARDGTPNVSYVSQIFYIDEGHVALSNQFMSKMVRNVAENPRVQAALAHPVTGRQLILDLLYERTDDAGPIFDQMSLSVMAVAAHHGMDKVMRLRSADVYRVLRAQLQEFAADDPEPPTPRPPRPDPLPAAALAALSISQTEDLDRAIELALDALTDAFGFRHCIVFLADGERRVLTAIASRGYDRQGAGAEVDWGTGLIGMAAERAASLRLSCVGRNFHYASNAAAASPVEAPPGRSIPMPGLDAPQSVLAVPMVAGGEVRGVIFAEAADRLAFSPAEERAARLIAAQLGGLAALHESSRELDAALSRSPPPGATVSRAGAPVQVRRHAYDDSVFFGADYVIKGVPGRLLWRMLQVHQAEGRTDFTNREFRLDPAMKLPDFKDNLETRLLLLSRRLAENDWPLRIHRSGRGRVRLELGAPVVLSEH